MSDALFGNDRTPNSVPNTGGSESGDVPYKNPAEEYPREDGWGFG